MAGSIAFSGLLSLFPFLIFAATLIGMAIGPAEADRIIESLFDIAPEHMARTISPVVHDILHQQGSGVLTLSAAVAIWMASNAIDTFRLAFDRAYEVDDPRGFVQNRIMAIGLVFVSVFVAALLGISIVFAPILIDLAERFLQISVPRSAETLTYLSGLVVLIAFITLMHWALPGRNMRGTWLWPGILTTAVLWLLFAWAFTNYLSVSPRYALTYGTLAGVIITLVFFYLTGATVIYGAELNAALDRRVRLENAGLLL